MTTDVFYKTVMEASGVTAAVFHTLRDRITQPESDQLFARRHAGGLLGAQEADLTRGGRRRAGPATQRPEGSLAGSEGPRMKTVLPTHATGG
jgi:uncharacterized protein (DUF2267 family)